MVYIDNFLAGHGHTPTTGANLAKLFAQEGYTVIPASNKQNKLLRLADMLFTIAANKHASVVLIATYSTSAFHFAWACAMACRLFRIPYIPCLHGGNLPQRIVQSPKQARHIFANSFVNVAVSAYLQKSMIDNNWKSKVIANNIDVNAYSFKPRKNCAPALFWLRSFHQIYNPSLAIYVLHTLSKKYPSASLTMVGPDKDGSFEKCKALAKQLNVYQLVTFTGLLPQHNWMQLAERCDIFINTTNFDNLPVSVVEAMALGMVTISTNVGGLRYLVEDGKNGLLVAAGDEAAFVSAIERVLTEKGLAEELSYAARKKAEQFDWATIKVEWNNLLGSIVSS